MKAFLSTVLGGAARARRGVAPALVAAALPLGGCQFFFPTPIELSADASTPAQVVRSVGVGFLEGERFDSAIKLDDLKIATGSFEVLGRCLADGKPVFDVSTRVASTGILTVFQSGKSETRGLVDVDGSSPVESHWDVLIGERRTVLDADFARGSFRYHQKRYLPEEDKPKESRRQIVAPIEQVPHDGHSVLGYLRSWEPPDGTRGFVYALMGRNLWKADLHFVGREPLGTAKGLVLSRRIEGVARRVSERNFEPLKASAPRPFTLWISDDQARLPLRILLETEVAKVTVELERHRPGEAQTKPLEPCAYRVEKKELAKARPYKKTAGEDPATVAAEEEEELKKEREEMKLKLLRDKGLLR
jgi:hypothetical protein